MSKNEYRNQLKRIFTGYRRFTSQIEHELSALGICTGRKKNHVVLFVCSQGGVEVFQSVQQQVTTGWG